MSEVPLYLCLELVLAHADARLDDALLLRFQIRPLFFRHLPLQFWVQSGCCFGGGVSWGLGVGGWGLGYGFGVQDACCMVDGQR